MKMHIKNAHAVGYIVIQFYPLFIKKNYISNSLAYITIAKNKKVQVKVAP